LIEVEFIETDITSPEIEEVVAKEILESEGNTTEVVTLVNPTDDEPEFIIKNLPIEKENPAQEIDDIPFEIKNLNKDAGDKNGSGEQLGLF
jgi:hypothetical protein